MTDLTHIESLVINETLDDAESLEEIYRSLAAQAISLPSADSPCATEAFPGIRPQVTVAELADAIRSLVERGLLIVHHDPAEPPTKDLSYVWRCWFEAGAAARKVHQQSASVG